MRGQIQSGSRRLNRHWQSGRGGSPVPTQYIEYTDNNINLMQSDIIIGVAPIGTTDITLYESINFYKLLSEYFYLGRVRSDHPYPSFQYYLSLEFFFTFYYKNNGVNIPISMSNDGSVSNDMVTLDGNTTYLYISELEDTTVMPYGRVGLLHYNCQNPRTAFDTNVYNLMSGNNAHITSDLTIPLHVSRTGLNEQQTIYYSLWFKEVSGYIRA